MLLSELQQQSALRTARVRAGRRGLDTPVQSVNMMDAPDIERYLKEGQLLLTTGYSMKEEPERLPKLIAAMARIGCAGLGLKPGRFLQALPQEAVEAAEEHGLPLLELSEETALGDLVHETLALILQSKETELQESKDFHERLSRLLHQEDGLTIVMREIEKKVRRSISLMDHRGAVLYTKKEANQEDWVRLRPLEGQQQLAVRRSESGRLYSTYPIQVGSRRSGLFIVEGELPSDHGSALFLSQAANVISFELMKQQAVHQHERMMRNAFFNDVLEGSFQTNAEILSRGKFYGLEEDTLYLTAAAQVDTSGTTVSERVLYERKNDVYDYMEALLPEVFPHHVLFSKGELFVLLVGIHFFHEEVEQQFTDGLADLQTLCRQELQADVSFGVGHAAYQLVELSKTWQEAVEALHAGLQLYQGSFIQTSRTKGMQELLNMVPDENQRSFVEHRLQPLLQVDQEKERRVLLETLQEYLAQQTHIARTAEALHVHRNTVLFRLRKCEDLLGTDVKAPATSLELRLALHLHARLEAAAEEKTEK
ncbi:PucR family transcriptional regulator [Alkalicoccus chagannorensis]|uniref:PucR family transcriptional regulator n=1 Tax=Alkalicoccus chagannorensis TaxID=427072 RepID=UPI000415EA26|nr:PucR family transcriptional regulator [Alkalicoccus chagannorensis]